MLKKIFWLSAMVVTLIFIGCGSSSKSSDEGKELMSKILNFVGIPTDIVVAICIDSDEDGICASTEVQAKVTLNKGDSFDDIWKKLTLDEEGQYFLEVYDETLPILVQIQDKANVDFDNGKFTLNFDGFETTDDYEEKEISILQSMIENNALSSSIANRFKTLINSQAQDKFYTILLSDLESNINKLRTKGLDSQKAVSATIKEMGDEVEINQDQANRINSCEDDQTCIDKEIKSLSDELLITEEESNIIAPSDNEEQESENQQLGKWVTPSQSDCKSNGGEYNSNGENQCSASWYKAKEICKISGYELPNIETLSAVVTDCGGIIDDFDDNSYNESYQSCYKDKGFSSSNVYWSSTAHTYEDYEWIIAFSSGSKGYYINSNSLYVRCAKVEEESNIIVLSDNEDLFKNKWDSTIVNLSGKSQNSDVCYNKYEGASRHLQIGTSSNSNSEIKISIGISQYTNDGRYYSKDSLENKGFYFTISTLTSEYYSDNGYAEITTLSNGQVQIEFKAELWEEEASIKSGTINAKFNINIPVYKDSEPTYNEKCYSYN